MAKCVCDQCGEEIDEAEIGSSHQDCPEEGGTWRQWVPLESINVSRVGYEGWQRACRQFLGILEVQGMVPEEIPDEACWLNEDGSMNIYVKAGDTLMTAKIPPGDWSWSSQLN